MKKINYALAILAILSSNVFASEPRWVDLKDKDGDIARIDRQGTKVQIDMNNTIGWKAQKMKVFYRVVFKDAIQVPNSNTKVDEEHFEVNIGCSNLYPAYIIEKNWYYKNQHIHKFTFGKGRTFSTLITENAPMFYIMQSCPAFDPDAVEDGDKMPLSGR